RFKGQATPLCRDGTAVAWLTRPLFGLVLRRSAHFFGVTLSSALPAPSLEGGGPPLSCVGRPRPSRRAREGASAPQAEDGGTAGRAAAIPATNIASPARTNSSIVSLRFVPGARGFRATLGTCTKTTTRGLPFRRFAAMPRQ